MTTTTKRDQLELRVRRRAQGRHYLTLELVCLVRSWPSLGITPDDPQYGLKVKLGHGTRHMPGGTVVATGRTPALIDWADQHHHTVIEGRRLP